MLKATRLLEKSISKKLGVGDGKIIRFSIGNSNSLLN